MGSAPAGCGGHRALAESPPHRSIPGMGPAGSERHGPGTAVRAPRPWQLAAVLLALLAPTGRGVRAFGDGGSLGHGAIRERAAAALPAALMHRSVRLHR